MLQYAEKSKWIKTTGLSARSVQGSAALRHQDNRPRSIAQRKKNDVSSNKITESIVQKKENETGLPDTLKSGIENLSGHSMDDVKVHYNSSQPAQLNAHAYAQGSEIHIAPGQEKHLPHEAWHVVQQKQGRVKPTMQLKSAVPVNDDPALEKEADRMGEKAIGTTHSFSNATHSLKHSSLQQTAQLKSIEKAVTGITHLVKLVNGSLYNRDYKLNEGLTVGEGNTVTIDTNVRYRSRRGPNQEAYSGVDKRGPQHYLWYKVLHLDGHKVEGDWYIREDTITDLQQREALAAPIDQNVYGTDQGTETKISINDEVRQAYEEGQRDFDCAYGYHKGTTYQAFRSFKINKGPVRIIYKFKIGDLVNASIELARLARTKGVIIHTIMLHELPQTLTDKDIHKALDELVLLAKTYHAQVGLSNVGSTGSGTSSDLAQLERQLLQRGVRLSMVSNRMNPAVPDEAVQQYCHQHHIKYLAYGLTGPSSGITCGLVPGSGTGDYKYLNDPAIEGICKELGISAKDFRYVVYTWARRTKGVSIVTRSSDREHRRGNVGNVKLPQGTQQAIDYFGPSSASIYPPFLNYLKIQGIHPDIVQGLIRMIGPGWLELYYKDVIVGQNENVLLKLLQPGTFHKLQAAEGKNRWDDVSAMRTWITLTLMSDPGAKKTEIPEEGTLHDLLEFSKETKWSLFDKATVTEIDDLEELLALKAGTELVIFKDANTSYFFVITKSGGFKKLDK